MTKIFSIGMGARRQTSQREDGQWFVRERTTRLGVPCWGKWEAVKARPEHAWYDPRTGKARLPK